MDQTSAKVCSPWGEQGIEGCPMDAKPDARGFRGSSWNRNHGQAYGVASPTGTILAGDPEEAATRRRT